MAAWFPDTTRLAPPRLRGVEWLDDPATPWALRERSHRDIQLANRWLGGDRAIRRGLRAPFAALRGQTVDLLDVGAGLGTTLDLARDEARAHTITLRSIGLDLSEALARATAARHAQGVCANALALPFATASIDVVLVSLLLHHFEGPALLRFVREVDRVARHAVVIHDLRRSRVAAAGLWALSWPLAFHPVSRHDGVTSVHRGFTAGELARLVREATGTMPAVARHAGFRLVARWTPTHDDEPTR